MPRDYNKIERDIAVNGFFSEYLPPCFNLPSKVLNRSPSENCDLIPPYSFTMSRYDKNNSRRNIFLPEIGSYIVVRNYIRQNNILKELIEFSESEKISFSPILSTNNSIMKHEQSYDYHIDEDDEASLSNYIDNLSKKIVKAQGAKYVLKLDISNCFTSFYIHMIPAIVLGERQASIEFNKFLKDNSDTSINPQYLKYKKLDKVIRKQNLNRTNGLLTGVLTSKVIAEALLTRIDKELLAEGVKFSRYMDDYEVYLFEDNENEVINIFTTILKKYGFGLNYEKTEKVKFPYYVLKDLQRRFNEGVKHNLTSSDMMELFNTFFQLEEDGVRGAVRYLIKNIETRPLITEESGLFKAYILTILNNDSRSLSKACTILLNQNSKISLNDEDFKLIINLLEQNLNSNNDLEVIWLLYVLIRFKRIKKSNKIIDKILSSDNELAKILLLESKLLNTKRIEIVKSQASSWILLYQLYAKDTISEEEFANRLNLNKNKDMYKKFKTDEISFVTLE